MAGEKTQTRVKRLLKKHKYKEQVEKKSESVEGRETDIGCDELKV